MPDQGRILQLAGAERDGEKDFEKNEEGADGYGGVGDVEGGPGIEEGKVQETEPDFQKIGDGAVEEAVGEIAGGATEKQSEAGSHGCAAGFAGDEHPSENGDDDERSADEKNAKGGRGKASKKTKTDSRVARIDKFEDAGDGGVLKEFSGTGFDPGFRGAVEKNDDKGEPEPAEAMRESHKVKEVNEVKDEEEVFARWKCLGRFRRTGDRLVRRRSSRYNTARREELSASISAMASEQRSQMVG
jgi:hypothetical protein